MWKRMIIFTVAAITWSGCGRKGPIELTLDQVPEAMRTAFATARPAMKTNAEGVAKLVTDRMYPAASLQLQALGANTELTEEQRNVVAGATIAVNGALQEQAAAAEPAQEGAAPSATPTVPPASKEEAAAAAAVLEHHIRTK